MMMMNQNSNKNKDKKNDTLTIHPDFNFNKAPSQYGMEAGEELTSRDFGNMKVRDLILQAEQQLTQAGSDMKMK
jgi:hypothetical protein